MSCGPVGLRQSFLTWQMLGVDQPGWPEEVFTYPPVKIQQVNEFRLQFLQRISYRQSQTLLVVAGVVDRLGFSQLVASIWSGELGGQHDLVADASFCQPLSDPFL